MLNTLQKPDIYCIMNGNFNGKEIIMSSKNSLRLFLLGFMAYFSAYLGRCVYSAALPEIIIDTSWDKSILGLAGTLFFLAYGAGQLINGILGDKVSSRKMIFLGLTLSGVSNIFLSFTNSAYTLTALWFFNGLVLSMVWSPLIRFFATSFDSNDRYFAATRISFTIPCGTIISFLITALCIYLSSWRTAFFVSGICVLLSAFIWIKFTSAQEITKNVSQEDAPQSKIVKIPGMVALFSFVVILVMAQGVIKDGVTMWAPTYISEYFNMDSVVSILMTIVLPIVNLSGVIVASKMNLKIKSVLKTVCIMFLFAFIILMLLYFFGHYSVVIAVLFLSASTACTLGINSMLLSVFPMFFSKYGKTSTVTGLLNCCAYVASAISSYGLGVVSIFFGWNSVILLCAIICAIAVLTALLVIKIKHPLKKDGA